MGEDSLPPALSLVFPIFNEEAVIPTLIARLEQVIADLEARDEGALKGRIEAIFVNDGSRDGSVALLREAACRYPWARVLAFSRNFGHQIAVTAGMQYARGAAVVIMD